MEGMETDAVDERPPSASPASPTRKEKRNDTAMGKATPRAPRSADLGRCRFCSDGCAPSPAGGLGEGAGGSITWMGDPSLGCRRSPDAGAGRVWLQLGAAAVDLSFSWALVSAYFARPFWAVCAVGQRPSVTCSMPSLMNISAFM